MVQRFRETVTVTDSLDRDDEQHFVSELALLMREGVTLIRLDLGSCRELGSAAFDALSITARLLSMRGGRTQIVACAPELVAQLRRNGLDKFLQLPETA